MTKTRTDHENVFSGPDAIKDLLNPDCNPPLPLVELPVELNPFSAQKVRIFAKLLYLLPLMNLKSLPVLTMLQGASGQLNGVHTIVENSSGNTAFSMAIMARLFGIRSVKAIVPVDIAPGKLELLRLAGADVRFAPPEGGGVALARRIGERPGFLNLDQYGNPANIAAHARWTTQQAWEQTKGKLTIYCAGLGTTGTALGAIRFFRENASSVIVVGVYCLPNSAIPGVRSIERLQEVSFEWESEVPHRVGAANCRVVQEELGSLPGGTDGRPQFRLCACRIAALLGRSS